MQSVTKDPPILEDCNQRVSAAGVRSVCSNTKDEVVRLWRVRFKTDGYDEQLRERDPELNLMADSTGPKNASFASKPSAKRKVTGENFQFQSDQKCMVPNKGCNKGGRRPGHERNGCLSIPRS